MVLLAFGCVCVMVGVAYAMTPIPEPHDLAKAQSSVFTFRGGAPLGRIGARDRTMVPLSRVPDHVQRAVVAAENRTFYFDPGVSVSGIGRALWADLTGGELQGGSTITQQYAKIAFLTQERTITRKVKELFVAVKLDRERSKDEILHDYLNTIYFGRGAYGVQAASQAYFRKDVNQLNVSQGAFLAAVLNSPGNYDPANGKAAARAAHARWHYVVDGMVEEGWLTKAKARKLSFPKVLPPPADENAFAGPRGYLIARAIEELKAMGYSEQDIRSGGLHVRTTFDRRMQRDAVDAVRETLPPSLPKKIQTGLVSVKPGTGEVLAMYGGRNYLKHQYGNVYDAQAQPGSSFKAYDLAAALREGIGLKSRFDGHSPQTFGHWTVHNDAGEQFGMIDLITGMAHSVNTVYAQVGLKAGIDNVIDAAADAGLPQTKTALPHQKALLLGAGFIHPITQAAGYATFASGGVYAKPHVILDVRDAQGNILDRVRPNTRRAFSKDITADVTYALQSVLKEGTGAAAALPDRPAAGKTGTASQSRAAWFVGYTPQLSTAVAMFKPQNGPLQDIPGVGDIYGATLPAPIWQSFMEKASEDMPVKPFPDPVWVGHTLNPPPPSPTAEPSTESPTPLPSGSEPPRSPFPTPSEPEPPTTQSPSPPPSPPGQSPSPSGTCWPWNCDKSGGAGGGNGRGGAGGEKTGGGQKQSAGREP